MAYVDTEKVLETARDGYHSDFGRSMADLTSLREVLEDTPTADVVEVKHGEWIVHQNGEYWHYDCPFCDDGFATKGKDLTPPNYCGNCGAKMDGRSDTNDR